MRPRALFSAILVFLAACQDDSPTSPRLQVAVAGLFADGARLQVGEVLAVSGGETQAIFVDGGEEGAEYLLVPFNASDVGTNNLSVQVTGGNVRPPSSLLNPARARTDLRTLLAEAAEPVPDREFHRWLREQEVRELTPLIATARAMRDARTLRSPPPQRVVPSVGDTLTLNASTTACENPNLRSGRVVAVTERAIVVEDVANPAGGFTDAEFLRVAETFDEVIYPVDVGNFGAPSDIDDNNRVIIFYTRVVNELSPPNSGSVVGGFFFGRDLFPRQGTARLAGCETSNEAEIFYLLAPDPEGAVNGNVRPKEFVLRSTLATVAHEFQHLINASRRIFVNNAGSFEEVWLNEGLSHIAEELVFYAVTPLEPRQNIDLPTLRSSEQILQAVNTYQISNFGRYNTYLKNPAEESLLGIDNLPTRGASWAFLRYAADQEPGPDQSFFFRLVNNTEAGVQNLNSVLGTSAIDLMQTWTVSVFTDDAIRTVSPLYQQPSWNFRSIMPALRDNDGRFPLDVIPLSGTQRSLTLKGGGAAFIRFGIAPGQRAVLTVLSGGAIPPDRLRVSLVRLQ